MSQKALKKKEQMNLQRQEREQYHQLYQQQQQQQPHSHIELFAAKNSIDRTNLLATKNRFSSTPNIHVEPLSSVSSSASSSTMADNVKVTVNLYDSGVATTGPGEHLQQRGHSETDISKIPENKILVNAKSEFHLKSIASSQVPTVTGGRRDMDAQHQRKPGSYRQLPQRKKMVRGSVDGSRVSSLASSNRSDAGGQMQGSQCGFADTDHIRIPIIGYEVMEERARFTVFKLRVENPFTNDCWLVLRRYTDFQRLNTKLRSIFPHLNLALPRKKLFGDNFSSVFLSNRVQGLQLFINSVMGSETLRSAQVVRDFFCLDEPPTYSESMEECRAIFEAQEETISHLKLQLRTKDEIILDLQQQLANEIEQKESLANAMRLTYANCFKCSKNLNNFLKESGVHVDTNTPPTVRATRPSSDLNIKAEF